MKKYKISEFSRKMGVSVDLVKHYQSSEILFPDVDPNNGYRYYTIRHGERIVASRKYRKMGFSVNEAKEILYEKDVDEIKEMLHEKKLELDQKIKLLQLKNSRIQEVYEEFEEMGHKVGSVEIHDGPGFYYLPHVIYRHLNDNEKVINELPEWMESLEFLYKTYDVKCKSDNIFYDKTIGFYIDEKYFDALGFKKIDDIEYYKPSKRLIYYMKEEYSTDRYLEEYVMEFIEKGLKTGSKIKREQVFAQHIMDSNEDGKRYMYYKIICFLDY
ncbi:MAG: MerR family transcriptional regulator [bacterium]|nr:MerR family transcriptional regulator [bacterium]